MQTPQPIEEQPQQKTIIGYRCTSDGKHWAHFPEKKCRYCVPVYEGENE